MAIKIPRPGNIGDRLQDVDRFLREARSVAQLRHPSIVTVHDVGQVSNLPGQAGSISYLVSDFVEGITLADMLTARRPSFTEFAKLIADLALALDHAHRQGVVHRDVKPSNIMLERIQTAEYAEKAEQNAVRGSHRVGFAQSVHAHTSHAKK